MWSQPYYFKIKEECVLVMKKHREIEAKRKASQYLDVGVEEKEILEEVLTFLLEARSLP